jgi:arylsulfatase A-like enzyme
LLLHGNSLYEPLLHVPLIVACPGKIPSGIRVREPVALNGLPNTLLEMLGTDENFPGTSWVKHWSDENRPETPPEILVSELASQAGFPPCHGRSPICRHGSMRCLREGHLKYIRADDLEEELYDLAEDSTEEKNLINDPRYARDLERMRSHFRRLVVDPEPPKP